MKILGNILEGLGVTMLLFTACVDDFEGSAIRFLFLIGLWLVASVGLIKLGHFVSKYKLEVKRVRR